jgi:hypothetical protein
MTQHSWQRKRQVPVLDGDVGVADAGSGDLHHHFVGRWLLKFDFGQGERRAHFLHHCG